MITTAISPGADIRQIGSDIAVGEVIAEQGEVMGPIEIGLLASAGVDKVLCYRKPIIGVMSTGMPLRHTIIYLLCVLHCIWHARMYNAAVL